MVSLFHKASSSLCSASLTFCTTFSRMKSIVVVEVSKYRPRHPVLGSIHSQDRLSAIEHSTEALGVVGR